MYTISAGDRHSEKLLWLASRILRGFPNEVTGLRIFTLECGCIRYECLGRHTDMGLFGGTYRDMEDGPCEDCAQFGAGWRLRALREAIISRTLVMEGSL